MSAGKVVVKVVVKPDFADAFNSRHRHAMLLAMKDHVQELYAYSYSAYTQPLLLYFGPITILSSEGPQQGDPLGPLLSVCQSNLSWNLCISRSPWDIWITLPWAVPNQWSLGTSR